MELGFISLTVSQYPPSHIYDFLVESEIRIFVGHWSQSVDKLYFHSKLWIWFFQSTVRQYLLPLFQDFNNSDSLELSPDFFPSTL